MNKTISTKSTIEQLRKNGFKVRVIHRKFDIQQVYDEKKDRMRPSKDVANILATKPYGEQFVVENNYCDTRVTEIDVTPPNSEKTYSGRAYQGPFDNYNRKIGNKIALGRALKKFLADI